MPPFATIARTNSACFFTIASKPMRAPTATAARPLVSKYPAQRSIAGQIKQHHQLSARGLLRIQAVQVYIESFRGLSEGVEIHSKKNQMETQYCS
jgi:hypothetical protein